MATTGRTPGYISAGGVTVGGGQASDLYDPYGNLLTAQERTQNIVGQQQQQQQLSQQKYGAEESALQREHELTSSQQAFQRKSEFAQPFLEQLGEPVSFEDEGMSESERILIQSQEEAGEKELNQLQDVLSGAGIFSSGTLARGTGEILGATRAGVAQTSAGFAESRLTRRHQSQLAQQQQLANLIMSVLA